MISRAHAVKVTAALSVAAWVAGCESQQGATLSSSGGSAVRHAVAATATDPAGDELVAARVVTALARDRITHAVEIQVSVLQGRARLSGFVDSAAAKLRAGVLAAATDGVRGVDNRLILRYHAGIADDPIGEARVHL